MPDYLSAAFLGDIEDTSPPKDFELCYPDTPKPPKVKFRTRTPFLQKILNRGSSENKKQLTSMSEEMDTMTTDDTKVTFQLEVEAIPVENSHYSESEEYDEDLDSTGGEEEVEIEHIPRDVIECEILLEGSNAVIEGSSADEETVGDTSTTSSSISRLIKSFVLVDVGPNITDTVHEFTNLLSDVATRTIEGCSRTPLQDKE